MSWKVAVAVVTVTIDSFLTARDVRATKPHPDAMRRLRRMMLVHLV